MSSSTENLAPAKGRWVTIYAQHTTLSGIVHYARNHGSAENPNWYVEFSENGAPHYWKQALDGGQIVTVRQLDSGERQYLAALALTHLDISQPLSADDVERLLEQIEAFQLTAADIDALLEDPERIGTFEGGEWHWKLFQLHSEYAFRLQDTLQS